MSYNDFNLDDLKSKFGLVFTEDRSLFAHVSTMEISPDLANILSEFVPLALAIDTEKARSEFIVAPILGRLKMSLNRISLFSGIEFNVDKDLGLSGYCDFIISRSKEQYSLDAPVLMMVEAKNDNIKSGLAPCGAQMIAAQRFNESRKSSLETVYGCVTTGSIWKFLELNGKDFYIDTLEYHIQTPGKIMGILSAIVCGTEECRP
ncbi:MAG: hypothetical protein ACRERV_02830 [Methylococcales bacterium]